MHSEIPLQELSQKFKSDINLYLPTRIFTMFVTTPLSPRVNVRAGRQTRMINTQWYDMRDTNWWTKARTES